MKVIKILLGIIVGVLALIFIGTLFMSPHYRVERAQVMNATPERIFPHINNLSAWREWMVWAKRDPNMKITYSGPESGVGCKSSWESESEGSGEMTISESVAPEKVAYDLYFPEYKSRSIGVISLEKVDGGTKVNWVNEGEMDGIVGKIFVFFMDSMLGPDFETNLANLKTLCEKPLPVPVETAADEALSTQDDPVEGPTEDPEEDEPDPSDPH